MTSGLPGLTPAYGAFLAEAAAVCLDAKGHRPGVRLSVKGDFEAIFTVEWSQEIGQTEKLSWGDTKEAMEYGATALAILLMLILTDFDSFERNPQTTAGDYVLKKSATVPPDPKGAPRNAILEISGILEESETNELEARVSIKESQMLKNKPQNLPGYIVVVEFGKPKAKIIQA